MPSPLRALLTGFAALVLANVAWSQSYPTRPVRIIVPAGAGGPDVVARIVATEVFNHYAGTKMTHVPYKGGGPAAAALVSGEVQVLLSSPAPVLQHAKNGRARVLAYTGKMRARRDDRIAGRAAERRQALIQPPRSKHVC